MASLRKRYQQNIETPARDAPPVTTTPQATAAELPPAVSADTTARSPLDVGSPVEEATKSALRTRLAEVERADALQREAIRQQPRYAAEPQQPQAPQDPVEAFLASVPEPTANWLRAHPEF